MPDVCSALLAVFAFVWNSGLALVALYLGGFGTVPIYLSVLAFALVVIAYLSGKLKCPEIRCCPKSTEGKGEVRVVTMNSLRDMLADEVESPPVGAAIDVAGKDIVLTIQTLSGKATTLRIDDKSLGVDLKRRIVPLEILGPDRLAVKDVRLFVTVNGTRTEVDSEMTLREQLIGSGSRVQVVRKMTFESA
eukprot:scaffold1883_cov261-Pinguiococcus_pyrenoidosus.AAC.38